MTERINGRVAIVTGASRGIGAATARALAERGATVVLAARDRDRLEAVRCELPGTSHLVVPTDVSEPGDVAALVDTTLSAFGRVELLVNNAGVGLTGLVADIRLEDLEEIFAINVFGVVAAVQACIPHMRRQRFGHIVNVSSILGKRAVPQTAGYAATKFALHALSDGLRVEEAPHGIAVTVVCPGSTDTDFRENEIQSGSVLLTERPRLDVMSAHAVGEVIAVAIERRRREVVLTRFGKVFSVAERLAPSLLDRALRRAYHR